MFTFKHNHSSRPRRRRRFAGFEPLESRRVLATFVVTSTAGTGSGSLHQQIVRANAAAGFDEIVFDMALDGQTISLATDSLLITNGVRIDATSLPNGVTIDASAADPTPSENKGDGIRAFELSPSATRNGFVELAGLTITGGDVTGQGGAILGSASVMDSHFFDNAATEAGGAIAWARTEEASLTGDIQISGTLFERNFSGLGGALYGSFKTGQGRLGEYTVTLEDVEFRDNVASAGGAAWLEGHYSMSIKDSTFLRNMATSGEGGGLRLYSYDRATPTLVSGSTFSGNSAAERGGGFFLGGSTSEIRDGQVNGNSANSGGGGMFPHAGTISDSVVENNSAVTDGGGIIFGISGVRGRMIGTQVRNNVAGGRGGGISALSGASVTVSSSLISGNSAASDGGGIFNFNFHTPTHQSIFELASSSLINNVSGRNGGGAAGIGATNSTISGNTAFARGGGIYTYRNTISFSTIVNNRSDADPSTVGVSGGGGIWGAAGLADVTSTFIANSIVAGNGLADEPGGFTPDDVNGPAGTSYDFNPPILANSSLIEVNLFEELIGSNNLFDTDPLLGELADNGGPALTHLPLDGSPVIDAGNSAVNTQLPEFDQRGTPFSRFRDGDKDRTARYDFGAIEVQGSNVPPSVIAGDDAQVKVNIQLALDGSATVDPDNGPLELTYLWSLLSGPEFTGGFADATQPMTSFITDTTGVYELVLTVDDGADSSTDTITVTVSENGLPTASTLGSDQATLAGIAALLVGTESFVTDGDAIVSYAWTLITSPAGSAAGSAAVISSSDAEMASLSTDVAGIYEVQLVVTDEAGGSSEAATTSVSVVPGEVFPGGPYVVVGDSDLMLSAYTTSAFGLNAEFAWDLDNDGEFDDGTGRALELGAATLADLQTSVGQQILPIAVQATSPGSNPAVGRGTITFLTGPATGESWHNPLDALDLDRDTVITPVDALLVINELNDRLLSDANGFLPPAPDRVPSYVDVDDDGFVSPLDALQVINGLPNNEPVAARPLVRRELQFVRISAVRADEYFSSAGEEMAEDEYRDMLNVHLTEQG